MIAALTGIRVHLCPSWTDPLVHDLVGAFVRGAVVAHGFADLDCRSGGCSDRNPGESLWLQQFLAEFLIIGLVEDHHDPRGPIYIGKLFLKCH